MANSIEIMKALLFLHRKDHPDATSHSNDSIETILQDSTYEITWHDLQRVLRQQPTPETYAKLESCKREKRLSKEKLDEASKAINFLMIDKYAAKYDGILPSIYHVLWHYTFLEEQKCLFRGQRDCRWRQDTTLFRSERDGNSPTIQTVIERLDRTKRFLTKLEGIEEGLVGRELNEDERLALAQHYGMPTSLLDYTKSLAVAAFFATGAGINPPENDIGVIFYVSSEYDPLPRANPGAIDIASATGLQVGQLITIDVPLTNRENRISRQKGVFLRGFDSNDLQRLSTGVLLFRQNGRAFEDAMSNITRDYLLSPDQELQKLANDIINNDPPLLAAPRLTAARLPTDNIFGSIGLLLPDNLSIAQTFLNNLVDSAERIEPGFGIALNEILKRHFSEGRIVARTSETSVILGTNQALDDVDATLHELAHLANIDPERLITRVSKHRPAKDQRHRNTSQPRGVEAFIDIVQEGAGKGRVVELTSMFIVGLERMRTVGGATAREYFRIVAENVRPDQQL